MSKIYICFNNQFNFTLAINNGMFILTLPLLFTICIGSYNTLAKYYKLHRVVIHIYDYLYIIQYIMPNIILSQKDTSNITVITVNKTDFNVDIVLFRVKRFFGGHTYYYFNALEEKLDTTTLFILPKYKYHLTTRKHIIDYMLTNILCYDLLKPTSSLYECLDNQQQHIDYVTRAIKYVENDIPVLGTLMSNLKR